MKPIKNSVAYVIYGSDRKSFLAVQRPSDDDDLPNVWGLPAGSLKDRESFEESVIRSGKEKLGIVLEIISLINEGDVERKSYILHMREYEARIMKGTPKVPQKVKGVTQYKAWKWAEYPELKEAAQKGSLCSRLYLSSIGKKW